MPHFEFILNSADGLKLQGQGWDPETEVKAVVCLIHGHGEHSGRYDHVAAAFNNAGFALLAFDLRGHGRSEGRRGHAPNYPALMADMAQLLETAKQRYPARPVFLYGHSLGGNLAIHYTLCMKPHLSGVIATAPLLRLAAAPPVWKTGLLRVLRVLRINCRLPSGLNDKALSHDLNVVRAYRNDPLTHNRISPRLAVNIIQNGKWNLQHAAEFSCPLLLMHGDADRITSPGATREFAAQATAQCTLKIWEGFFHELHNEPQKQQVLGRMVEWMNALLDEEKKREVIRANSSTAIKGNDGNAMTRSASTHSFAWLNATQFFGALNDNVFKLLVIFFLVDHLGFERKITIGLAAIIFVVPFLLFSHAAGVLADRYSKQRIVLYAKRAELLLMALGLAGILLANAYFLYALLFLMCTQSAFFGPSKYSIIPELVKPAELSRANSFLVGLTYLAIIIGTFLPSLFLIALFRGSHAGLAAVCVGISTVGLACSMRIEETPPVGSTRQRFTPLFVVEIFRTLFSLRKDHYLFAAVLSAAYFLFLGAFIQQNLLLLGPEVLGWDTTASGYLFPMAAIGIALGALVSGKLSGRSIELGLVPVGAAGLAACCLLLGGVPPSLPAILSIIFGIGFSAGLFIVPFQAFVQQRSPHDRLGEILACKNFLNFLGVAVAAVVFLLLTKRLGMTAQECFTVSGLMTAGLATAGFIILPGFIIRFLILVLTRITYRIRTTGDENIPGAGPALLISNHVTWSDALILAARQQRHIRFMLDRSVYRNHWLNPLFRLMKVIPVSPDDPPHQLEAAIQTARQALDDGHLVCTFPEPWLSRNGRFEPDLEQILKGTAHPLIPVYIEEGHGRPTHRIPVTVVIGTPLPSGTTISAVRQAVSELAKACPA